MKEKQIYHLGLKLSKLANHKLVGYKRLTNLNMWQENVRTHRPLGSWREQTCSTLRALWRKPSLWTGRGCFRSATGRPWWSCSHRRCQPRGAGSPGRPAGTRWCTSRCLRWDLRAAATWAGWLTRTGGGPGRCVGKTDLKWMKVLTVLRTPAW